MFGCREQMTPANRIVQRRLHIFTSSSTIHLTHTLDLEKSYNPSYAAPMQSHGCPDTPILNRDALPVQPWWALASQTASGDSGSRFALVSPEHMTSRRGSAGRPPHPGMNHGVGDYVDVKPHALWNSGNRFLNFGRFKSITCRWFLEWGASVFAFLGSPRCIERYPQKKRIAP